MTKRTICILLAALVMLALTGCMGDRPAPTPEPMPTFTLPPTAEPTATPEPTATATPTATPKPTPSPTATPSPTPTPAPSPTATPAAMPSAPAPVISKQPFGETQYSGASAIFIANADSYTDVGWRAVTPDGQDVNLETFRSTFPNASVTGEYDTTLKVGNLSADMNGWSFYCVFGNRGTLVITNKAALRVLGQAAQPAAQNTQAYINCPICGELIPANSRTCPYCYEFINSAGIDDNDNAAAAEDDGDQETATAVFIDKDYNFVAVK